jgi:hypothetical protein
MSLLAIAIILSGVIQLVRPNGNCNHIEDPLLSDDEDETPERIRSNQERITTFLFWLLVSSGILVILTGALSYTQAIGK